MKRIHVKKSMKKVLAFSLAAAMVVPSAAAVGSITASADSTVPDPVKSFTLDRGFEVEGLDQAKFGQMIGFIEDEYPAGSQYAGIKYFDPSNGRLTGQLKKVDTVLKQGSWVADESVGHKGYTQVAIPAGAEKQYLPDISTKDGTYIQMNPGWNQPTTAYDSEKGMVFWLDDTLVNQSYPTYATIVDWENGTWTTDENVLVKDTEGQYMEFDINNSAAVFDNPFVNTEAAGITFSAWIKNTTEYKAPVTYTKVGDLDGNESITAEDALEILKHVVGIKVLDDAGKLYADTNNDGDVTADDALDVLKLVVGLITGFERKEVEGGGSTEETVQLLEDSEFFHVEKRVLGTTLNAATNKEEKDERNILSRQYLYFSGNGVTYVGDFTDPQSACTWILDEAKVADETENLLNVKNGGKWNYVSYTFDGADFHMYLNGKEVTLVKTAGTNYTNDIMNFVKNSESKTYLGGRGGGMKDNFNTYAIKTSNDYYMDDIALYTSALSAEQLTQAYAAAQEKVAAENSKTANVLKTYSFEGTSLSADELTAVSGSNKDYLPSVGETGKVGNAIKLNASYQTENGGVQLKENPFAGRTDLNGVTISYWMKSVNKNASKPTRPTVVEDGVLFSFIDDAKEITHEKVTSEAYLGANAVAKSQLYLNQAFIGMFCEGVTKPIGANSLKNIFNYKPYTYGDPNTLEEWKKQFDKGTYDAWKSFRNSLAADWNFVTVTFNNAGFVMYLNGEEVKNTCMDFAGERFCDFYLKRQTEIVRKGTNNANARTMMDFITASDTKAYIGFGYEQSSETNFLKSTECYLDELTFYDKDMSAAEVQALYEANK